MVMNSAKTVADYLASLPPDRRVAIEAVRKVIKKNLPRGFEEGMQYGMIGYYVPLSRYPETYNGQPLGVAALASQKGYMSVYLMCVYGDHGERTWFEQAYKAAGKKLDMGKSCVRFKSIDDLPVDVIGQAIARVSLEAFLAQYEALRALTKGGQAAAAAAKKKPAATTKSAAKKITAKKSTSKRKK